MGRSVWGRAAAALVSGLALAAADGQGAFAAPEAWVGTWSASQQIPEPKNALAPEDLKDATLRQVVHLSLGGRRLRIRLSNAFGTEPLHLRAVHVARATGAGASAIDPQSDRAVTFDGRPDVVVPAGGEYLSDPVDLDVAPLSSLSVSVHFDAPPAQQTGHPGSRAASWIAHGDRTGAADLPGAKKVEHWYTLSGVEVEAAERTGAIVALGDSITDGHGATTNGDDRWTDNFARRIQDAGLKLAVLNEGIGGNRLLLDGLGPSALSRVDRDVLAQAGARWVIVLEGVNDIGTFGLHTPNATQADHDAHAASLIGAYRQIIERAHARGIKVIGATVTPFQASGYYHPDAAELSERETVNRWIRGSGAFDAVIDFDAVIRDPANPERMAKAFDSGDGLHPSVAGYRAMAAAIPLSLFGGEAQAAAPAATGPEIAFTFDDLPAHAALPQGETRLDIAERIIAALQAHGMEHVYGFVNGVRIEQEPASAAVLPAWREAGFPLGNHTWSHPNLNSLSSADFETEIARNEPLLKEQMGEGDWRWFRYPFLSEGDAPEKKAEIRRDLAANHYKIAAVTMSFGDWAFNDPYARCVAKGDQTAIAELETMYLDAAKVSIPYYRAMSKAAYGRDIRYVLLMHLGALDARLMPRLLDLYQAAGFRFVTLPEAEKDPFYRGDVDPSLPEGPVNLEAALKEKGLQPPALTGDLSKLNVVAKLDKMCR